MNQPISRPRLAAALAVALFAAPAATFAAEDRSDFPRRPDGRPDFSGTYDTATLTPLVRPAELGDRLTLSQEEADAIAEHWRTNFEKDYVPSDPNRGAPPEGGVGIFAPEFLGAAGEVGGYNAFYIDIGENSFKLDGKYRTSIITDPPNGRHPPLSDLGTKLRQEGAPFRHKNTGTAWWMDLGVGPYDDPEQRPLAERCILSRNRSGPPSLPAMYNNLKTIVQTYDHVMILAEQMHDARIIRLSGPRASTEGRAYSDYQPSLPKWMGDSVGYWEGDTLVVETTHFRESSGDRRTTEELRVVERFSRIDRDALRYRFTVHDPRFTEPWSGEYPWPATDARLYEYACHEGNYALGNIMRGARILEADAGAGSGSSE